MSEAQLRYKGPADARRVPAPDFKVGDKVYVKARFFRTTRPLKKLSEKYLGPYTIIAKVGLASFMLSLPPSMHAIHPVFHVSMLEVAPASIIPNHISSPPLPIEVDGNIENKIAKILDSKIDQHHRQCQLLYLV